MKESRYTQLLRLFYMAESLRGLHFGLTADELWREVCNRSGSAWCQRTIYRDAAAMEALALVERRGQRFYWLGIGGLFDQLPGKVGAA